MSKILVGLDLSLANTAAVMAPVDWGLHWGCVPYATFSAALPKLRKGEERVVTEDSETQRVAQLSSSIVNWVLRLAYPPESRASCTSIIEAWIEERVHARQHGSGRTAELHAVVKHKLFNVGIHLRMVTSSAHRKVLLGEVPSSGAAQKTQTQLAMRAAGCPGDWGHDLCDAMSVLNYGMSQNEACFFGIAPA